jgi:hypothetical protein
VAGARMDGGASNVLEKFFLPLTAQV